VADPVAALAAGFLGSHLIDRLMGAGEEVICHDVTDPIRLEVDRIWHLACPASPLHDPFNPIKTAKTSFLGTCNMLGLKARRLSSSSDPATPAAPGVPANSWRWTACRVPSPECSSLSRRAVDL